MTREGVLIIEAKRYRTQEQNRSDAILRFTTLVQKAIRRPRTRRPTHPSLSAQIKRIESKKKRGVVKKQRNSLDE